MLPIIGNQHKYILDKIDAFHINSSDGLQHYPQCLRGDYQGCIEVVYSRIPCRARSEQHRAAMNTRMTWDTQCCGFRARRGRFRRGTGRKSENMPKIGKIPVVYQSVIFLKSVGGYMGGGQG